MCHITYIPSKKFPQDEQLEKFLIKTYKRNPEGAGLSFYDKDGKPKLYKNENSIQPLIAIAKKSKNISGFLFHTRIASRGETNIINNHPFHLGWCFLCHNGTMSTLHPRYDIECDTRELARMIVEKKRWKEPDEVIHDVLLKENYWGSTIVLQSKTEVKVFNYYRFTKATTKLGNIIYTSSGLSELEAERMKDGDWTVFPTEDAEYNGTERTYSYTRDTAWYDDDYFNDDASDFMYWNGCNKTYEDDMKTISEYVDLEACYVCGEIMDETILGIYQYDDIMFTDRIFHCSNQYCDVTWERQDKEHAEDLVRKIKKCPEESCGCAMSLHKYIDDARNDGITLYYYECPECSCTIGVN